MAETDEPPQSDPLIVQLFYLLTVRLEDAAGAAAEGQSTSLGQKAVLELANRVHAVGQEVMILADTIVAVNGAPN